MEKDGIHGTRYLRAHGQPHTPRSVKLLVDALAARFRGKPWKAATDGAHG